MLPCWDTHLLDKVIRHFGPNTNIELPISHEILNKNC